VFEALFVGSFIAIVDETATTGLRNLFGLISFCARRGFAIVVLEVKMPDRELRMIELTFVPF